MKGISKVVLAAVLTMGIVAGSWASDFPKKNPPKSSRAVEDALKAIGGKHYPKKLSHITKVGSVKTATTWYHVYSAYDRDTQTYRALIFDNTPRYLGYYEMPYEPTDVGEGQILVTTDNGEAPIPIPDKGPAPAVTFQSSGYTANFVKAPAPKEATGTKTAEPPKAGAASLPNGTTATNSTASASKPSGSKPAAPAPAKIAPKYREWTVTMNGQEITFSAVFVKYNKFKKLVTLKSAKTGTTADIDVGKFSMKDKKYLAGLLEK